jgi:hypothetical protein
MLLAGGFRGGAGVSFLKGKSRSVPGKYQLSFYSWGRSGAFKEARIRRIGDRETFGTRDPSNSKGSTPMPTPMASDAHSFVTLGRKQVVYIGSPQACSFLVFAFECTATPRSELIA